MAGAEVSELLAFGRQAGVAAAGAAALWGFFFWQVTCHKDGRDCVVYEWLASRLLWLLFCGVGIAAASWLLLNLLPPAAAHEGIALVPETENGQGAADLTAPIFVFWSLASAAGLLWWSFGKKGFYRFVPWFFGAQFFLAFLLAASTVWTGKLDAAQFFFFGHNVHSIFTFGTVLVLDFLFLLAKHSAVLKQHFFPHFKTISKVIWIGLGIDFASSALVFDSAFAPTAKFFFMQTAVAILIVNGVLLAGPVARKLLSSVQEGAAAMEKKWTRIGDIAGTVSIGSWFSITLLDFFHGLELPYLQLFSLYAGFLVLLFLLHVSWNFAYGKTAYVQEAGRGL